MESEISNREKQILTGLYLSKYDRQGLVVLGFESFVEAFNVIGLALGSRPASIKNYRDEFDPIFSKRRKGWHKRATREYCLSVMHRYQALDFESFSGLIRSFFGYDPNQMSVANVSDDESTSFAQRLITGLAAENYFQAVQKDIPQFSGLTLENTTRLGCGYDFKLHDDRDAASFMAVEVKGLKGKGGSIALTPKEHLVAARLTNRYFLFVVHNFLESPYHSVYSDPLSGPLSFIKAERVVVQTTWTTRIS